MSKEGKDKVLPEENNLSEKAEDKSLMEETAAEESVVSKSDESLKPEEEVSNAESIDNNNCFLAFIAPGLGDYWL